ncbi:MAG: ABC transporter permease [Vicinamibacteria bacterium]|jgi:putative ABC transport system permease protein|nr:ABC transporter permease [Vicinamibacteria bacterium]
MTDKPGTIEWFRRRVATPRPVFFAMREAIGLGLAAIRAYKMRAGLTILGVVMGVMTVTGMSSIIAGLNRSMESLLQTMGSAVILIRPQKPGENISNEERRRRRMMSRNELRAIAERCPAVRAIAPLERLFVSEVKRDREKLSESHVIGTTASYEIVHDAYIERGRFLSEADVERGARVAVVGSEVVDALFPAIDPIDRELALDGQVYRVIGVMEKRGKFLGFSLDNYILIPLGSYQSRPSDAQYLFADLKPIAPDRMEDAMEQARETLRRARRLRFWQADNFGIFTQDAIADLYNKITGGIYGVMIAISCIGLVVGGVGVMNIMLVSVTERTREIGVRKALGATRRDVRWQFLTEAMTLTGLGGLIGVAGGAILAAVLNLFSPFPATLQPIWATLAFVTSVGTGLVFGLWPAAKAARLDPVEALRYE